MEPRDNYNPWEGSRCAPLSSCSSGRWNFQPKPEDRRGDTMTILDRRSEAEKESTWGFVVATDSFMSGWGDAPRRSLFAVPVRNWKEAEIVLDNMQHRPEMKRARIVGKDYRPKLRPGDHLSIRDMSDCARFYAPGGFASEAYWDAQKEKK